MREKRHHHKDKKQNLMISQLPQRQKRRRYLLNPYQLPREVQKDGERPADSSIYFMGQTRMKRCLQM